MRPLVSVIVPAKDQEAHLGDCLTSLVGQLDDPAALQVIVVDDGSTDGSPQLLASRFGQDPRVVLVPTANGGQLAAFQRGMALVPRASHVRPGRTGSQCRSDSGCFPSFAAASTSRTPGHGM